MQKKVVITGVNTSKIKILKKEESISLLKRYKNGENECKDKLILGNLKLILSVLKKININQNIDINDLFQIGVIGLIKAIENFNVDLNLSFSTYAIPMIYGEIRRYLRDNSQLKVSRQIKDTAYKVLKCKEEYIINNDYEPSLKEISKIINISEKDIDIAVNSTNSVVSLFEPIYNENGDSINIIDQLSDDYEYQEKLINYNTFHEGLKNLPLMQKKIIEKRYYEGLTQFEIAEELSISQAQVSRLEKNALDNLKKLF